MIHVDRQRLDGSGQPISPTQEWFVGAEREQSRANAKKGGAANTSSGRTFMVQQKSGQL